MKTRPAVDAAPLTRNPQQTRARILDAALAEFAAKGFAGARVDLIARGARINKRMLYHYFGDKEGLFREVLRRKITERRAWLATAPEDPMERLPHWFRLACRDPEWIRLLEWEALQWGEQRVIDESRRKKNFAQAVQKIRQRQARGLFPARLNPGQMVLSMMALTAYPLAFPQMARLATGLSISDPKFQKQREQFLREFAAAFRVESRNGTRRTSASAAQTQKRNAE